MNNSVVAEIFRGIAELLEIKGDNPFRIRAYLRAAENIETLKGDIEDYAADGTLEQIPGIGRDLADKIEEILSSGKCQQYEELKKIIPLAVVEMLQVPSIGPKTAKLFFDQLKIGSIDELEKAALDGRLLTLPGIKQKTVENILKGIELFRKGKERMDLLTATILSENIVSQLSALKEVQKISPAGSLRRMKDTVRDIDILVVSKNPKKVSDVFVSLPCVKSVLAQGEAKSMILTKDDVQVDLRVFDDKCFGSALLYFTGSKNHNIKLRHIAKQKNLKINEYGIFDKKDECLASKTEKEVYEYLGLDYIEPELREDAGEIEAAAGHKLPKLLEIKDIKGDFHVHTNYSDGKDSVEDMAFRAKELGYEYVCLADHSQGLRVAGGLDKNALNKKRQEIDKVNKKLKNFRILFGTEAEIDRDGNIDYNDDILKQFDIVVAAIHTGFKQPREQLTKRIVRACQNKYVNIIAHPTGKLWPVREPYEIDFKEVLKVAKDTNTALEISANPQRLDLSGINARLAKESAVKLAISTDSHSKDHLGFMKFGIGLAKRAWLTKKDVLNTLGIEELFKAIKK